MFVVYLLIFLVKYDISLVYNIMHVFVAISQYLISNISKCAWM